MNYLNRIINYFKSHATLNKELMNTSEIIGQMNEKMEFFRSECREHRANINYLNESIIVKNIYIIGLEKQLEMEEGELDDDDLDDDDELIIPSYQPVSKPRKPVVNKYDAKIDEYLKNKGKK